MSGPESHTSGAERILDVEANHRRHADDGPDREQHAVAAHITAETATLLPQPKGYLCAAGCDHSRRIHPAEAIDQIIAMVREHDRRASHQGPTVSAVDVAAVVAERFQGGEHR